MSIYLVLYIARAVSGEIWMGYDLVLKIILFLDVVDKGKPLLGNIDYNHLKIHIAKINTDSLEVVTTVVSFFFLILAF